MTTTIPAIVAAAELVVGAGRLRRFIGVDHGAGVSYFFVDNEPGQGPDIHRHPYPETWVFLEGEALVTIDAETLHAVAGDTATAPTGASN